MHGISLRNIKRANGFLDRTRLLLNNVSNFNIFYGYLKEPSNGQIVSKKLLGMVTF